MHFTVKFSQLNHIVFVKQEESYTSKASFFDKYILPIYDTKNKSTYTFSGKQVDRGLYQTKNGKTLNADVNAALNILNKSKVLSLSTLYCKGEVDTPIRIRAAQISHSYET